MERRVNEAPVRSPKSEKVGRHFAADDVQACPGCGHEMPALKGARLSICPICGYKESCCY